MRRRYTYTRTREKRRQQYEIQRSLRSTTSLRAERTGHVPTQCRIYTETHIHPVGVGGDHTGTA